MNHGERKQPAVTSFFSPAPKRRAPEEHSVSADENMQLPHDSWASKRGRLALKWRFVLQITLESISEGLSFKIFLGGHAPRTPQFVHSARFLLLQATVCPPRFFIPGPALNMLMSMAQILPVSSTVEAVEVTRRASMWSWLAKN